MSVERVTEIWDAKKDEWVRVQFATLVPENVVRFDEDEKSVYVVKSFPYLNDDTQLAVVVEDRADL